MILKVAQMIDLGLPVEEIRDILVKSRISEENAYLIYRAAEILSAARTAE